MPGPKKKATPRTPGEQPNLDQMPPQQDVTPPSPAPEAAPEQVFEMTESQLESIVQSMVDKRVEGRIAQEVRNVRTNTRNPQNSVENLPDQTEIDPKKIERAVLTKQGYVCPLIHATDRLRMENKL